MTEEDGLPAWLHGVARRMVIDFEDTTGINHRGSKGTVREGVFIREFLDKYLPRHVEVVHSGEIRSADGRVSPQQDVLIVDPVTPRLYSGEAYQVVPVECVYCVGEVKSRLDRAELSKAWVSSAAVKQMPKTAYRPSNGPSQGETGWYFGAEGAGRFFEYGKTWHYFPAASFIFAYDSIDLEDLAASVVGNALWPMTSEGCETEHRIDAIFILKKGFIYWGEEGGRLHRRPKPDSTVCVIRSAEPGEVLIAMTSWLNDILADAWMPRFDIDSYIGNASIGGATSWLPLQESAAETLPQRPPCLPTWRPSGGSAFQTNS